MSSSYFPHWFSAFLWRLPFYPYPMHCFGNSFFSSALSSEIFPHAAACILPGFNVLASLLSSQNHRDASIICLLINWRCSFPVWGSYGPSSYIHSWSGSYGRSSYIHSWSGSYGRSSYITHDQALMDAAPLYTHDQVLDAPSLHF